MFYHAFAAAVSERAPGVAVPVLLLQLQRARLFIHAGRHPFDQHEPAEGC